MLLLVALALALAYPPLHIGEALRALLRPDLRGENVGRRLLASIGSATLRSEDPAIHRRSHR
jgi:hypothetical protein